MNLACYSRGSPAYLDDILIPFGGRGTPVPPFCSLLYIQSYPHLLFVEKEKKEKENKIRGLVGTT